jgi:type IV secretory pathway VirB6-like protein
MLPLNVTVYIPGGKNKPGMVWDGYVSVAELSNTTMVGGATLQAGVLKRLTITAATPKFQPLYVLVAMLAIAGVALVAYYYVMPKMRARRAPKKKATEGAKARVRKRRATHRAGKAKKAAARTRTKRRAGQRKAATRRTATGGARRRRAARRR